MCTALFAFAAVFPATTLQTCVVHLIRNSLEYASWKDRKILAQALRPIYTATSAETAMEALEEFERGSWGRRYPTIVALWRRAWVSDRASHVDGGLSFRRGGVDGSQLCGCQ